ncbi:MAG: CocE/NonD family hydrolase [Moraxellaceae bacterium]|nr:CocE/NonD family hydrolase [Moraxellaceae bacterium]
MSPAQGDRLAVLAPEAASMTTRDGVRLDADVYRPVGDGPWPVLLQRQAYGRRIACTICYAHPAWYAAHGYIVVVQDVRGRGSSEGVFRPGEHELEDGAQAVEWAARLGGADGRVAMYGFSYQGYNQLLAAAGDCPSLCAIAPAMGPWDPATTWAYENGALRMKQMLGWGLQITGEAARRAGDAAAYASLVEAAAQPPFGEAVSARPAIIERHRALSHVMDWLETPADDPFWQGISPAARAEALRARKLPMLFVGGWFDTHLASTWRAFSALGGEGAHAATRLIVGPWLHFPWVRQVGQIDFGPAAARDMDAEHIRFFDRVLKEVTAEQPASRVELFDMGARAWRSFDRLPAGDSDTNGALALSGSGRAAIDTCDGKLLTGESDVAGEGAEFIVHDPWRPAPVTGGCYGVPPGPVDRRVTDERGDVAVFTTAPLDAALSLAGEAEVELAIDCDRASFDLSCVLSRVTTDGKVFQLASGYAHHRALHTDGRDGPNGRYRLRLSPTCATLAVGEALRLSVAASDFPAHPLNPGTGEDPVHTPRVHALITTLAIHHGAARPSLLRLPVQPATAER